MKRRETRVWIGPWWLNLLRGLSLLLFAAVVVAHVLAPVSTDEALNGAKWLSVGIISAGVFFYGELLVRILWSALWSWDDE